MLLLNNLGTDESRVFVNETLYQANPKESHLVVVKRILRYLKGTPNLGLWYPKGSGFDLNAYSDSGYAGCNLDRKSTSGGCQILGGKLVCWSAKKQSSIAMSSAEAKCIAATGCCAQVLWIKIFRWLTMMFYMTSENFAPLPPKEMVRVALATLGLADEKDPQLSMETRRGLNRNSAVFIASKWQRLLAAVPDISGDVMPDRGPPLGRRSYFCLLAGKVETGIEPSFCGKTRFKFL
ncbi:hypothetical protein Tco_0834258 [Tanacetum coccineum]